MRNLALAGLFTSTLIALSNSTASAEALGFLQLDNKSITVSEPILLARITSSDSNEKLSSSEPPKAPEPEPVKYKVLENDSLTTIAERHNTTWKRLFNKNESITQPDLLVIGNELIIPTASETLTERALPEPPAPAQVEVKELPATKPAIKPQVKTVSAVRGSSSGNTYAPGYCTWYVKNKRPDMPNNLGNADTWVSRAAAQGLGTGTTPRAGAVGQRGMHVVYVESINGDGTVNISEMNHAGLYVITNRTLRANYFSYVY